MPRVETATKKRLALEFIAKIAEGYRLTGKNKAFDEVMKANPEIQITQMCLYQFIRREEDLLQAYFQARDEQKKNMKPCKRQMGAEQKVELLSLIIENISKGMNIRGDTRNDNAVVEACKTLNLKPVHWATVHRWLRGEHKDLKEKYNAAMGLGKK